LIPVILSFAGLIFFSYRFGRLISPAVVLLFVSALPAALLFIITNARGDLRLSGPIPFLPLETTQQIAAAIVFPYYLVFWVGIGIIILADVLKLFFKIKALRKK